MFEQYVIKCGECRFEFEYGSHRCQGCQGKIIYGPTKSELQKGGILWATLYSCVAFILLLFLIVSSISLEWKLTICIPTLWIVAIWGYFSGIKKVRKHYENSIRTFRFSLF
jgi:hypothetical protein